MPIQRAAIFQVDQVLSLIVVGARSRFQSGLWETSVLSSTKSFWLAGDSVIIWLLDVHTRAALQELAVTWLAFELAFINHNPATRKDSVDYTFNFLAFVSVVVAVHKIGRASCRERV